MKLKSENLKRKKSCKKFIKAEIKLKTNKIC